MKSILCAAALAAASGLLSPPPQVAPEQGKQIFSRVDEMLAAVAEITGMKLTRPVPRALISRERIREYIEQRMAEALTEEELRGQQILMQKLGLVGEDYDLKTQIVDLLTEQAAAFYDFKQKKLYLASWAPSALQDAALVHELAHAVADQHFNLQKFIRKTAEDDDAAMARAAVVEGQATWVMTEYMLRKVGQSLRSSSRLVEATARAPLEAAKSYPVFAAAPLYMQESLMFPYTQGLVFQQAVFEKLGQPAFAEVFRNPPLSSQQVMHPERYFQRAKPSRPALPSVRLPPDFKKILEGALGEFDHQILLRQFVGEQEARRLAPSFKGSRYALWENRRAKKAVLYYAVDWESEADAADYFAHYRSVCGRKWKRLRMEDDQEHQAAGIGDDGRFLWKLDRASFTSVEGLP